MVAGLVKRVTTARATTEAQPRPPDRPRSGPPSLPPSSAPHPGCPRGAVRDARHLHLGTGAWPTESHVRHSRPPPRCPRQDVAPARARRTADEGNVLGGPRLV